MFVFNIWTVLKAVIDADYSVKSIKCLTSTEDWCVSGRNAARSCQWKVVNLTPQVWDLTTLPSDLLHKSHRECLSLSAIPAHAHTKTLVILLFLLSLLYPLFFPLWPFLYSSLRVNQCFPFCVHRQQGVLYLQGRHTGIRSHPQIHFHTHIHTGQCSLIVPNWIWSLACKLKTLARRREELKRSSDQCHSFPLRLPILIGIHKTHVACGPITLTVETEIDLF